MDIVININLNINSTSAVGVRVLYLQNCLNQLSNLYQGIDQTAYRESLNNCLLSMVSFIEADNIQSAIDEFDISIVDISQAKMSYFEAYCSYFKDMYNPP